MRVRFDRTTGKLDIERGQSEARRSAGPPIAEWPTNGELQRFIGSAGMEHNRAHAVAGT